MRKLNFKKKTKKQQTKSRADPGFFRFRCGISIKKFKKWSIFFLFFYDDQIEFQSSSNSLKRLHFGQFFCFTEIFWKNRAKKGLLWPKNCVFFQKMWPKKLRFFDTEILESVNANGWSSTASKAKFSIAISGKSFKLFFWAHVKV